MARVNRSAFSPGDRILFRRGKTWREQLTIRSSGTSGHPITFGAYGSGTKPIITGATTMTSFAQHVKEIYKKPGVTTEPKAVAINGMSLFHDPLVNARAETWTGPGAAWTHFKLLRVSDYYVTPSDLNDCKLYVAMDADADIGASARSDGHDIRFYDAANTQLTYQRIDWSVTNGKATGAFWVEVPVLKSAFKYGTGIWCFYGNPAAAEGQDADHAWGVNQEFNSPSRRNREVSWGPQDKGLDGRWVWASNTLYLGSSAGNPATVEVGQRAFGICSFASASHITIDGLEVNVANETAIRSDRNNSWTIQNCSVWGACFYNVWLQGNPSGAGSATGMIVQDNTIGALDNTLPQSGAGIGVLGTTGSIIRRNRISTVTGFGILVQRGSALDKSVGAASSAVEICQNVIDGNQTSVCLFYTADSRIYRNLIRNGFGTGIGNWHESHNTRICYNIIYNLGLSLNRVLWNGIDVNLHCHNGVVYNNIIKDVYASCLTMEAQVAPSDGWSVRNNIFDARGNKTSLAGMCGTIWIERGVSGYALSNNLHVASPVSLAQVQAVPYANLAAWAAASGEAGSLEGDPEFVSPSDFHLQSTSPCIDAGADVGLTEDYQGQQVPLGRAPDIGAYEYRSVSSLAPPD